MPQICNECGFENREVSVGMKTDDKGRYIPGTDRTELVFWPQCPHYRIRHDDGNSLCACDPTTKGQCGTHGDWMGKNEGPMVIFYGGGWGVGSGGGKGAVYSDSPTAFNRTDSTKIVKEFSVYDPSGNKVGLSHAKKAAKQVAEMTSKRAEIDKLTGKK